MCGTLKVSVLFCFVFSRFVWLWHFPLLNKLHKNLFNVICSCWPIKHVCIRIPFSLTTLLSLYIDKWTEWWTYISGVFKNSTFYITWSSTKHAHHTCDHAADLRQNAHSQPEWLCLVITVMTDIHTVSVRRLCEWKDQI